MWELDEIIRRLNKHHQRATFSAVAGLVGGLPRGLMHGRPRCQRDSWIVAKTTNQNRESWRGWPTGYIEEEVHPKCNWQCDNDRANFIDHPDELEQWLNGHP